MPTISVIIPVYNTAFFVAEAIDSILNQSFKNFELLIVNDASTDKSKEIILSYNDTRIIFIDNEKNFGPAYSRNYAIQKSRGKYIAFLDADDIALPNRLQEQFSFLEENREIGLCGSYAEYFGVKEGVWEYPISNEEIKCRLLWGSSIIQSTAMLRRNVLIDHNLLYDSSFSAAEDYKLWVAISQFSGLYNIPKILIKYRTHPNQLTVTQLTEMNRNKTNIIVDQLIMHGVEIKENDFEILYRFINYKYQFSLNELKRLVDIYKEFNIKNKIDQAFNSNVLEKQIDVRIFQACYFSTSKCGRAAFKLYKNNFGYSKLRLLDKIKFFIKTLY